MKGIPGYDFDDTEVVTEVTLRRWLEYARWTGLQYTLAVGDNRGIVVSSSAPSGPEGFLWYSPITQQLCILTRWGYVPIFNPFGYGSRRFALKEAVTRPVSLGFSESLTVSPSASAACALGDWDAGAGEHALVTFYGLIPYPVTNASLPQLPGDILESQQGHWRVSSDSPATIPDAAWGVVLDTSGYSLGTAQDCYLGFFLGNALKWIGDR